MKATFSKTPPIRNTTDSFSLGALDWFGLLAAFLVVAIHTSPLASFSQGADLMWTRILARVAVPFFLMRTGYFLPSRPLAPFCRKYLRLYGISIILYLPVNIYAGHFQGVGARDIFRIWLFDGTLYHLWYLPACILGVCIVTLLLGRLPFGAVTAVSLVLYVLGLMGDSWYGLTEKVAVLRSLYEAMFSLFSYTRNGIFYVPVFLVMGMGLRRSQRSHKTGVLTVGFLCSLAALCAEGILVHRYDLARHDSMYLTLLPCMYFLFRILLRAKCGSRRRLRFIATCVYVIHPLCIILTRGAAKLLRPGQPLNSLLHYFAVCLLSLVCAGTWEKIWPTLRTLLGDLPLSVLLRNRAGRMDKERGGHGSERAWIELDMDNLRTNVSALQTILPEGCRLMPAVKADAYGHGAVPVARELNRLGIRDFCVASAAEGMELRRAGIQGEILILGYTHPCQFPMLTKYHLTQTVIDETYAMLLNAYGRKLKVHLKIDTGMHRLGERFERTEELRHILSCPNLQVTGTYTHLCADEEYKPRDVRYTEAQAAAFYATVVDLEAEGFSCGKIHLLASYGLLHYPQFAGDYARTGIALYGVLSHRGDLALCPISLRPVLSVKARVTLTKELYAGESAGYGLQYTAPNDRTIAVLSIGYADGIPRSLSCGHGSVLIREHRAPIIGCVCMDQTLIDVTGIPGVTSGDVAVLIGVSGEHEITAYDLAEAADTITNELLSRLGNRLNRIVRRPPGNM